MSTKGIKLKEGMACVLELDGTLVYVESVTPVCAVVVAPPDQPATRNITPSFTPGRVGGKRISPYAEFSAVIEHDQLTPRNQKFILEYQRWREEKGINYVERTPEEIAALEAAAVAPTKEQRKEQKQREKKERKDAKRALRVTPRYLQKCQTCGNQPGHPDHGTGPDKHEFVPPIQVEASNTVGDAPELGEARVKPERRKRAAEGSSKGVDVAATYRWVGTPEALAAVAGANPKYADGNSGRFVVDFIQEAGEVGVNVQAIINECASHARWSKISQERLELMVRQLALSGLITLVV